MPRRTSPPPERRRVQRLTDGSGADVVVEMAVVPQVIPEVIQHLRAGGRHVLIGNIVPGAATQVVPESIVRRARQLVGVVTCPLWVLP